MEFATLVKNVRTKTVNTLVITKNKAEALRTYYRAKMNPTEAGQEVRLYEGDVLLQRWLCD